MVHGAGEPLLLELKLRLNINVFPIIIFGEKINMQYFGYLYEQKPIYFDSDGAASKRSGFPSRCSSNTTISFSP